MRSTASRAAKRAMSRRLPVAALAATAAGGAILGPRHAQCSAGMTATPSSGSSQGTVSYYGSYRTDRFGGEIGDRASIDKIPKQEMRPIPGTGVARVIVFSESRKSLKEWATAENWREATRIHLQAYFTRTTNSHQEEVLERLRQHYVSGTGSSAAVDSGNVEAALFRLVDKEEFHALLATTQVSRIPAVVFGVFNEEKDPCVVDFANKRLGGGWLGYGMAQEEKMFMERFDYGALCARSLLEMTGDPVKEPIASPFSMRENEAWILKGGLRIAKVPWYGRTPRNAMERLELCNPSEDVGRAPTVVAVDAIKADFEKYLPEHLQMMLIKAYVGFVAAKGDEAFGGFSGITTGSWGCGAFFNNERVMFVIQALAANLAGVDLKHHTLGDGFDLGPAFVFLEDSLRRKLTVAEVLDLLAKKCEDPAWQSKFVSVQEKRRSKL